MGIDLTEGDRMPDELILDDMPTDHIAYSSYFDPLECRQTKSVFG